MSDSGRSPNLPEEDLSSWIDLANKMRAEFREEERRIMGYTLQKYTAYNIPSRVFFLAIITSSPILVQIGVISGGRSTTTGWLLGGSLGIIASVIAAFLVFGGPGLVDKEHQQRRTRYILIAVVLATMLLAYQLGNGFGRLMMLGTGILYGMAIVMIIMNWVFHALVRRGVIAVVDCTRAIGSSALWRLNTPVRG